MVDFSERGRYPQGFILRVLGLLLIYALTRSVFFYFNRSAFDAFSTDELIRAFLLGLRFDAWVVSATLLPLFLLELWSWKTTSRLAARCARWFSGFVFILHGLFIFSELADTQYFRFTGRRTTLAILKLSSDSFDQSLQLLVNFWSVPLISGVLILGLYWLWRKTSFLASNQSQPKRAGVLVAHLLAGLIVGVLGLRGGFQTKPISTAHAMLLGNPQLAALALSTSFQLTHSAENREITALKFYADEQETRKQLEVPRTRHAPVTLKNHNVVVVVFESLSLEYFGYKDINKNYVPFVKSLAQKSLFFDNAYANGRTSIEAFPSILASVPSMLGEPFITSQYSSVETVSLGHELAKVGYQNLFFHGAKNGSMFIDSMAKLFGFPRFFGRWDYPFPERDFDGNWGIYDEPFLQFTVDKLNEVQQPFATGIFTLSSHNPYNIPAHLRDKFPDGNQPFHKSLGYADYAIEKFFERASQQPWFKNTLFVITGDHTADLESPKFMSEQGYYRVPLIIYDPSGQLKPGVNHRIVQHTDIFPTLLDLLGIDASKLQRPLPPFGQSVFLPEKYARAANRAGDWFWYQEGRTVVRIPVNGVQTSGTHEARADAHNNQTHPVELVTLQDDTLTPGAAVSILDSEQQPLVNRARAYLQFFNNRMIGNSLLKP